MAENLNFTSNAPKTQVYEEILPQLESIISAESNLIANLANVTAVLQEAFNHLWTGFYLRDGKELVLGPFQGPLACTRIPVEPKPRGVCGACASQQKTLVVPNVDEFPGHIACSSKSKSEIVVPLVVSGITELVLDIDSEEINTYDSIDKKYLEKLINLIEKRHF